MGFMVIFSHLKGISNVALFMSLIVHIPEFMCLIFFACHILEKFCSTKFQLFVSQILNNVTYTHACNNFVWNIYVVFNVSWLRSVQYDSDNFLCNYCPPIGSKADRSLQYHFPTLLLRPITVSASAAGTCNIRGVRGGGYCIITVNYCNELRWCWYS